jgi:hypothetical protein
MRTRRLFRLLLACLAVGLCLAAGGYAGLRAYRSVRQARFLKQARQYLAQSETKKAFFCAQRALRADPHDVDALRLLAELDETTRSPGALLARSRVVELRPRSVEDRLALVRTALLLRDYTAATNALDGVANPDRSSAAYHTLAGALASNLNQPLQAEAHFLEAARIEPQNPLAELNLAVLRLHSGRSNEIDQARASLIRLSENSTNSVVRCQALRERTIAATRAHQSDPALRLCHQLLEQTNSVFRDQLLRLDILRETPSPEFNAALSSAQRAAAGDSARIYELATWQTAAMGPRETLAWLQTLPRAIQTNQPTALLLAECQCLLADWAALQAVLTSQRWQDLEFMRHAFLARALRGLALADSSRGEWEQAIKASGRQKACLVMLLRLAAQWSWVAEQQAALWTLLNEYPGEEWAYRSLAQGFFLTGQTRSLMMLYSQRVNRAPSDLSAKNNLAMTALLLDAREFQPHKLARDLYAMAPTNATFASTYAFSLNLQKRSPEALVILQRLNSEELERPAISAYYGLVLQASGNPGKAKKYLELGLKAPLLPEERKLVERARAAG